MSVPRSFLLSLLGIASAFSQEPAPPTPVPVTPPVVPVPRPPVAPTPPIAPPGVPIPSGPVTPAAGAPGANIGNPQPGVPLGETKITAPIEEFKLNGDGLAGLYHKFTGRRVIVVTAAAAAEFRFIQDASPQDPLTYDVAAQLLRKAAVVEGFVFVPS